LPWIAKAEAPHCSQVIGTGVFRAAIFLSSAFCAFTTAEQTWQYDWFAPIRFSSVPHRAQVRIDLFRASRLRRFFSSFLPTSAHPLHHRCR
jgi:hypothetical protein